MIVLAAALMALLLGCIIASCIDVWLLCEHESKLAELWDDGDEPIWIRETRAEIERLPEVVS